LHKQSRFQKILIFSILWMIILSCISFDTVSDAFPDMLEATSPSNYQQPPESENGVVPTSALQITLPAFSEGELPVSAVVQIIVEGLVEGYREEWSGSGTLISPDGLILTNAHVAVGDRFYRAENLVIAFTVSEDQPPVPTYFAKVVQSDSNLDIAVLQISTDLSGRNVDRNSLNLPYVSLGDSDALHLGDIVTILGYPGIGGETITLTRGDVSGFTAQAGYGNRAFIKTSATIAGGNSGGLAVDANYELIGIPTQVGAGGITGDIVDCRPLADTNRDGIVNGYDTCVPTGGFINALRPINLAMPLINAAVEGKPTFAGYDLPDAEIPEASIVLFEDDFSDKNSGWPESSNASESYSYQDGRYVIEIKKADYIRPVNGGEWLQDVIIEIDADVERSSQNGDYGVICRYQDDNNLYMFEITQDGYYAIYKLAEGEWYPLIDYTYTPLLQGISSASFEVSCIGDTLRFAVNGKLLGETRDTMIPIGDYGFFVGTFDQANNTVSFDNLVVSEPQ